MTWGPWCGGSGWSCEHGAVVGASPTQAMDAALGSVGFSLRTRGSSEGIGSRLVKPKYRGLIWTHLFLKNRFRTNHKRGLDPWI